MKPVSRAGSGLAVLAGIACVACCTLPILISGGIVGGAGAVFLADKMPVIAVVLAVGAVLSIGLAARRRTAGAGAGCGGSCKRANRAGDGCGCTGAPD
jgi:mercuric ion transport protein